MTFTVKAKSLDDLFDELAWFIQNIGDKRDYSGTTRALQLLESARREARSVFAEPLSAALSKASAGPIKGRQTP